MNQTTKRNGATKTETERNAGVTSYCESAFVKMTFDVYVLRVREHHASTDICMARLAGINKAGFVGDGEQKV